MIDHVSREVADLELAARFYDALFYAVGVRRLQSSERAIAYGIDRAELWLVAADGAGDGNGHVAVAARGKAGVDAAYEAGLGAGGSDDGAPQPRPGRGPRCYAAYLRDPDGLRVEVLTGD